jgi:hypothetical protein
MSKLSTAAHKNALSLYTAAQRARTDVETAWEKAFGGCPFRGVPVGWDPNFEAASAAADAYHAASEVAEALERQAAAAIEALPWGPCGAFFVSSNSCSWAGIPATVTLWANRRALASVSEGRFKHLPEPRLPRGSRGPSRAQQTQDAERVREVWAVVPPAAIRALVGAMAEGQYPASAGWGKTDGGGLAHPALPAGWEYLPGQEGGRFRAPNGRGLGAGRALQERVEALPAEEARLAAAAKRREEAAAKRAAPLKGRDPVFMAGIAAMRASVGAAAHA